MPMKLILIKTVLKLNNNNAVNSANNIQLYYLQ